MEFFYMRNPAFAMVTHGDSYSFFRPGETPVTLSGSTLEGLPEFMQRAARPLTEAEVDRCLGAEIKAMLCEQKVLLHAPQPVLQILVPRGRTRTGPKPCGRLILGLTGAVSSLQVVPFVLDLLDLFASRVDVVLTEGAQHLVNPEAFAFLGAHAWTDAFEPREGLNVPHIQLAEAAELVVVLPASAHSLHKFAQGACSDLLSLIVSGTSAPVVLFPAMNESMWNSPAIKRNVELLRQDGHYVVEPQLGREVADLLDAEPAYGVAGLASLDLSAFLESILHIHQQHPPTP